MFWYNHDMGGWGYAGMGLGMLLFWGLLIVGTVFLIRMTADGYRDVATRQVLMPAEEVLAQRFARGDIDEKEYADRVATLRAHSTTA
ncbi:SHOCT domain-containing protein [Nocardia sp. NPDC006630]|uniref:SHOCT domain-containing protein n=1 Tax=Nocardia sp. NPDC006630 TaxID=3157181 RepID=UPI0033AE3467